MYSIISRLRPLCLPAALLLLPALSVSCDEDDTRSYVPDITDPAATPTMSTTGVSTLISDSGYTKYHITTDVWNIYDELPDPIWTFPRGVHLINYNQTQTQSASLTCDSATYYSQRRLWRLDGHVVMINTMRDTFLTQQLFWDQNRAEVYSDSFIHITKAHHIIEGYGFTSNQTMTAYTVNTPTAIIPVERGGAPRQSGAAIPTGTPTAMPGMIDPDDATRGDRPAAPEPASVRNSRRQEFLSSDARGTQPHGSSSTTTPPPPTPRQTGSVTRLH